MTGFGELGLAAVVAAVLFQLFKWAYRRYIIHDTDYDFHEAVYFIGIPTMAFFVSPALAWLGVPDYVIPPDLVTWIKEGVLVAVTMLGTYFVGINPLKTYRNKQIEIRNGG